MSLTLHYIACGTLADTAECALKGCRPPGPKPTSWRAAWTSLPGQNRKHLASKRSFRSAPIPVLQRAVSTQSRPSLTGGC